MYKYRRVIISVIALLLAAAILTGLLVTVFAANSADIRTEISGLESKQDELDQKKQELEAQILSLIHIFFFHPDCTVGPGISPDHAQRARGLYRRSGISPCPEESYSIGCCHYSTTKRKCKCFLGCG